MITVSQLQNAVGCTNEDATLWVDALNAAMQRFSINTPKRQAAFLSQIGYESEHLSNMEEDFDYSSAALVTQWPLHFTVDLANKYGRTSQHKANWEMIANIAYANRFGNGNIASGDGWRYRGRGPTQTTFLDNYKVVETACGIKCVENPDILLQPIEGSLSSAYYWFSHGCNELADVDNYAEITDRIHGSTDTLKQRSVLWDSAKIAFGLIKPISGTESKNA